MKCFILFLIISSLCHCGDKSSNIVTINEDVDISKFFPTEIDYPLIEDEDDDEQ